MEPIGALARVMFDSNAPKRMVGPWGLEPQTSTVSKNPKSLSLACFSHFYSAKKALKWPSFGDELVTSFPHARWKREMN
jgi:hypothetical protein